MNWDPLIKNWVFQICFYVHPYLGKWSTLTCAYFSRWVGSTNHQLQKQRNHPQLHREYNKPPNWIPINQPIEMPLVGLDWGALGGGPETLAQLGKVEGWIWCIWFGGGYLGIWSFKKWCSFQGFDDSFLKNADMCFFLEIQRHAACCLAFVLVH